MKVAQIWRYSVKTMAGERLHRAKVGPLGIDGDRVVHVEDARGRVFTSRSHPRSSGHKGSIGAHGEIMVDGRTCAGSRGVESGFWMPQRAHRRLGALPGVDPGGESQSR